MKSDPIVEEIRKHRQAHAARFNFDIAEICRALREVEKNSTRPIVNHPPRLLLKKSGT
jgi:hypothetical protein